MNHIRRAAAAVFGGGGKNKPNKGIIRNDMPVSSQDDDHDSDDDDDDDDDAPLHGRQSERGDIEQQQQPPQHTKGRRHRGGRRALRERHTDSMRRRHEQYFSTRRSLSGGGGADFYIPSRRVVLPKMKQRETNATKQQQYQPVVVTSSFSGDNNQRTSTNSTEKEKTKNKNHHSGPVVSNESTPLIRPLPTTPKTYSPSQRPQRRQSSSASDRSSNASSSSSESSDDRPVIAFPFLPGRKEQHQQATASSPKNRYWATLKKQVHQGTFLVSEVLSKDSELLDMDDEKGIGGGNVNGITFYNGSNNHKKGNKNSNKSVEELRQRAIENFQKGSTFSPQLCLLAIFIYLIIAVFMFCFLLEPQWTVIDSCYFAVSTFTTLGYGDLAPTSTISVIFTTVYALAGVACLGLALGILGSKLLETKEDRRRHEDFSSEYAALTLFDRDDDWSSTAPSTAADDYPYDSDDDCGYFEAVSDDDDEKEGTNEKPTSGRHSGSGASSKNVTFDGSIKNGSMDSRRERNSNGQKSASRPSSEAGSSTCSKDNRQSAKKIDSRTTYPVGYIRFVILLTITMIFAFLIGYSSGWGFWSTVYYTVTTAATIGYGDLTPHTQEERFLAIIFIPFACSVTGQCLTWFATWVIDKQGAKHRKSTFDAHKDLTPEDLKVMDITGDGKVAWFEFLEFMLVAMKKVDPELLDELRAYFDRLDVSNTGELSKEDLVEMARRKMRSPRRKLELCAYKEHLLKMTSQATRREGNQPKIQKHWYSGRG